MTHDRPFMGRTPSAVWEPLDVVTLEEYEADEAELRDGMARGVLPSPVADNIVLSSGRSYRFRRAPSAPPKFDWQAFVLTVLAAFTAAAWAAVLVTR